MASNSTLAPNVVGLETYYQYIGIGSFVILLNLLLLIVLFSNRDVMKKSAFIFGLAIGDILDGLSLFISGILRIKRTGDNTINSLVHPSVCMLEFTPLLLLGRQIPGTMFFLIGIERLFAVKYFRWYFRSWNDKISWMSTFAGYIYVAVSISVAYGMTFSLPINTTTTHSCITPNVVGAVYMSYNYSVSIVGSGVAIATTLTSLIVFRNRRRNMVQNSQTSSGFRLNIKRQMKVTKTLLAFAVLDFFFLAVPSILEILTAIIKIITTTGFGYLMLQIVCFRGSLNIFIYLLVNRDFRIAATKLLGFKSNPSSAIAPTATNVHGILSFTRQVY